MSTLLPAALRRLRGGVVSAHTMIPGFPGYSVDLGGNIWSLASDWRGYGNRMLKPAANRDGYLCVRLVRDGLRLKRAVHVLVAETMLGPRPTSAHEVRHLNGCRTDNHPTNIAWGTRKDNADDRERHGRTSRGSDHSRAIRNRIPHALTRSQRALIIGLDGKSQREIAALVGCSQSGVGAVLRAAKAEGREP